MGWFSRKAVTRPNPDAPAPYPYGNMPRVLGGQFPPRSVPVPGVFNANNYPGAWPLGIPNVDSRGMLDVTGQPQPLPQTLVAQLLYSKRTRYRPFTAHSFVQARLPDPGAPQYTFDALGLVEFSPVGTGVVNRGEIRALEGAPLFPNQMVPMQGLGGIVQGQLALQALMNDPLSTAALQVET